MVHVVHIVNQRYKANIRVFSYTRRYCIMSMLALLGLRNNYTCLPKSSERKNLFM